MPTLSTSNQTIAAFHIKGMYYVLTPGDKALIAADRTTEEINYLNSLISRVEHAYSASSLNGGSLELTESEYLDRNETTESQIAVKNNAGDTIIGYSTYTTSRLPRTTNISKKPTYNTRTSAYYKEVERLAIALGIDQ